MSQIIKPVALDESVQVTNQKLEELSSRINNVLQSYAAVQEATLSGFSASVSTTMSNLAESLVGVLASVKSINGKYGVVVLDSGIF